ncbi:hypothetical protein JTB14_004082 [Gonioctena quinquepunctata]|nr:hypothetical protein JTB14_004082 [Gonioctena quinquepunctata]
MTNSVLLRISTYRVPDWTQNITTSHRPRVIRSENDHHCFEIQQSNIRTDSIDIYQKDPRGDARELSTLQGAILRDGDGLEVQKGVYKGYKRGVKSSGL